MNWTLRVSGVPAPKGSWDPVGCGKPVVVSGERHYRIRDVRLKPCESDRLMRWKHAICLAVLEAGRPRAPLDGCAFAVEVVFYLHRPKLPRAALPIVAPDVDKLERAVGDVLQGIYWADDSQITDWSAHKRYADAEHPAGAEIEVTATGAQKALDI